MEGERPEHRSTAGEACPLERNPRPSSRETAKPPRWVSGRGKACRGQPSVRRTSPLFLHAERTEAGPGREQVARRVGPMPDRDVRCLRARTARGDQNSPQGPWGDLASRFVGLLRFRTDSGGNRTPGLGPPRSAQRATNQATRCTPTVDRDCFRRDRSPNGAAWRFPDWTAVGFRVETTRCRDASTTD